MIPKVLFILKRREDYNSEKHSHVGLSTGLYNSASFVVDMLNDVGVESILEVAIDNNCIDRLVTKHRPTHVIVEALWVVPSKFTVLTKLHPNVKWIIRLHSEMPFMAGEGMAMDWLGDYIKFPQISIGINAPRMLNEIRTYLATVMGYDDAEIEDRVVYMPNFYPQEYKTKKFLPTGKYKGKKYWIDICCFGAVRPLKNHMEQAVAAVKFANKHQLQLRFHINSGRIEMQGSPALHNLQGFFQHLNEHGHQLISHEWTPREQFLELCATMDIGLQCNFSETFNIVSADLISQGVPIVGCEEIPWSFHMFNAKPAFSDDIAEKIEYTFKSPRLNVWAHQKKLTNYTNKTKKIWVKYFNKEMQQ